MTHLTQHFTLKEFTSNKYTKANTPNDQEVVNMVHGCLKVLEPARAHIGCSIIVTSGYRSPYVNRLAGGVYNSQHLQGCAADIKPSDPDQFSVLVKFLAKCEYVDQLLTAKNWCHVSWTPWSTPRHQVIYNYYK